VDTFVQAWAAESETKRSETARVPSVAAEATDSPERLMERFLDGDALAFERLFKQLAPRVASTLGRMSGDARLAEDLTQVVFLKLYRARAAYQRGMPLAPWVFAIARNVFLDERRRRRRRRETLSADGQLPELPVEAPQMSDERARLNLEAVLGSLPPNQREALVLLKMQGLSLTEVAAFAGTSVASIKMRLQRAYRSLRVHLREEAPAASSFEQGRTRR
jgi:RNA polymerase sigma-70 factor (ECF subfamily)